MAPSRFAPNAVVEEAVLLKRCANTRLARKIGANASAVATTKRTGADRFSNHAWGTAHAMASDPNNAA